MCTPPERPKPADADDASLPGDIDALEAKVHELSGKLHQAEGRILALEGQLAKQSTASSALTKSDRELRALAGQLERQAMLLERDEQVARELQNSLRPVLEEELQGIKLAPETRPGIRVGGDFYDAINLGDKFVAFVIADVSGYGLPAAVIMATGRLAFRTCVANDLNAKSIMDRVNSTLVRSTLAGHYLTAFLAVLDTELLTLQYVNASHCPPFLVRDGKVEALDTEGLFVGMFEEPQYELKSMQLEQYDRLFFYTDGLLRSFEGSDREACEAKLRQYLCQSNDVGIETLVNRLTGLKPEPEDDVAVLGVEVLFEKAERKVIAIPSLPREMTHAENAILPVLENMGYGERAIFAVKLALEEAIINAIKHGNELDDTKKVQISFAIDENQVVISVKDEGEGFNPEAVPDPTTEEGLLATSGRGLALIRAYMDEIRFNETGNELTMIKHAPWAAAAGRS